MNQRTILIADDNPGVRRVLAQCLRGADRLVLEAADGDVALELARTRRPDLIILDVRMPGRDGHAVCSELQDEEGTRGIPVLMLSGSYDAEYNGIGTGARGYLSKPFNLKELNERVRSLLELSAA